MHSSAVAVVAQLRTTRSFLLVVALATALLVSALPGSVARVRGAEPAPLKAVFIVGPTDGLTASNLVDAEALAVEAEAWGMDVRRVFFPHATWEAVLANIQGANLVVYMGHGYGWPSPYTQQLTEARQNGMGLNTFDGSGTGQYTYYGANVLKANVVLAPNAIVFLNHLCYSAGNGEPGMAVPTLGRRPPARRQHGQWLAGNRCQDCLRLLVAALHQGTSARSSRPTRRWIRSSACRAPSPSRSTAGSAGIRATSTPCALRAPRTSWTPSPTDGFYRAVTGDLNMTAAQWAAGTGGAGAPNLSNLDAARRRRRRLGSGGGDAALFTPNGDGVTDSLTFSYTRQQGSVRRLRRPQRHGDVVRNFTAWSRAGTGSSDLGRQAQRRRVGRATATTRSRATPRNRGGEQGDTETVDVKVFTTMRAPAVTPAHVLRRRRRRPLRRRTTLSVNLSAAGHLLRGRSSTSNGNVVRTMRQRRQRRRRPADLGSGTASNDAGAYVPDGTYYSVMTTATSAGTYSHSLPVEVRAFRLVRPRHRAGRCAAPRSSSRLRRPSCCRRPVKPKVRVYCAGPGGQGLEHLQAG